MMGVPGVKQGEKGDQQAFVYPRQKYPTLAAAIVGEVGTWMQRTKGMGKYAIVNPDIDGLLSYCILKVFDPTIRFGGYYLDEYQLLLTPEAEAVRVAAKGSAVPTSSFLSVENDLLIMDSIGQHFCILDDPRFAKINPNALRFGTSNQKTLRRTLKSNFGSKYPLSTAFFLWTILLATPESAVSDEQLVGLLYPDSAIVKSFGEKYKPNVLSWLEWMGHAVLGEQFYRLQGTSGVIQIARCIYKTINMAQPSVTFEGIPNQPRVNNKAVIKSALNYFCGLLNIEAQEVYDGVIEYGLSYCYKRVFAERQSELRDRQNLFYAWLENNIADGPYVKSKGEDGIFTKRRVVSEAVTTYGEWSVTTHEIWGAVPSEGIAIQDIVVAGRNAELQGHINRLGLDKPCQSPQYGCVFPKDAHGFSEQCSVDSGINE